jgi:hypothetical protein
LKHSLLLEPCRAISADFPEEIIMTAALSISKFITKNLLINLAVIALLHGVFYVFG